jgi:hypothetical protein
VDTVDAYGAALARIDVERRCGDPAALARARQVVLADGAERGVRAVEFRTATGLTFDVLVDRGMDIGDAAHAGRPFGWRSATGTRHPGLHENGDEDGFGWLRSFSGLLVTGGLDHIFAPDTVDARRYRYPGRPTIRHPLHGRVANTPARLLSVGGGWTDGRYRIWAEGEVRQAAVFGEHLVLRRRIEADADRDEIRIRDEVTNEGFDPTPHQMLYHVNLGWPLLDEGARLVAPTARIAWQSASVAEQGQPHDRFPAPLPRFVEQVYEHELVPDAAGMVEVALVNERLGMGVAISWPLAQLPRFVQWSHLREGGYALGLEPATHAPAGTDPPTILDHGDRREYHLTLRLLPG